MVPRKEEREGKRSKGWAKIPSTKESETCMDPRV
jgi:hypothetical protein